MSRRSVSHCSVKGVRQPWKMGEEYNVVYDMGSYGLFDVNVVYSSINVWKLERSD